MPAWINRPHRDTSVYDFELMKLPWTGMAQEPIAKSYRCKKTGKIVTSEALPRAEGKRIFVKLADEWKEDKTEEALNYIMISRVLGD